MAWFAVRTNLGWPAMRQFWVEGLAFTVLALGFYIFLEHILRTLLNLGQIQYQTIEQNPLPMLGADADGLIVKANPAAQALYGLPAGALQGRSIESLHLRKDHGQARWVYPQDGTLDAGLFQILQGRQPGRWVQVILARHQHARPARLLAVIIDKTTEVLARQETASFARYIKRATDGPDGYLALDRDFNIAYCNANYGRLSGIDSENAVGKPIWDAHQTMQAQERMTLVRCMAGSFAEYNKYDPQTDTYHRVTVHPTHVGLALLSRDITAERRKADADARQALLKKQAFDQAADCIWIVSRDYKVLYGNPAYLALRKDLTERAEEDHLMRSPVVLPRQPQGFSQPQATAYAEAFEGKVISQSGQITLADGSVRTYQAVYSPIAAADGEVSALMCVSRDITTLAQQTDELRLRVEHLKSIAWFQSNEVRGPLARMMGILQVLPIGHNLEQDAWIERLRLSAKQMDEATRSVLREVDQTTL